MKHLGIDVHQKTTEICELSAGGKVLGRSQVATTESGLRARFGRRKRAASSWSAARPLRGSIGYSASSGTRSWWWIRARSG